MSKRVHTLLILLPFILFVLSAPAILPTQASPSRAPVTSVYAGHGPKLSTSTPRSAGSDLLIPSNPQIFWYERITHNGISPFIPGGDKWKVFRNVATEYHADQTGRNDAQPALQRAINGMRPPQIFPEKRRTDLPGRWVSLQQ